LEVELEKSEVQSLKEELPVASLQSIPKATSQSTSNMLSELNSKQPAEKNKFKATKITKLESIHPNYKQK
jgi:hypothetical protein